MGRPKQFILNVIGNAEETNAEETEVGSNIIQFMTAFKNQTAVCWVNVQSTDLGAVRENNSIPAF